MKELELRRANTKGWAVVGRTSIEQEETAEVIVPDAQPDIWQVWDASTCLLLQRKEVREGQAALYGLLKVTILYQPEGTGGVERMEATLPFDAAPELPGLTRQSLLYVSPKVLGTETRLLNPRKILVRVAYQLVYRREGRWEFENAQLIYDDSERFSAFGDQEGAVSAGWKQRTLRLDELADDAYGYALVQLVSIDRGKLRVHAGRVLCVLPEEEPSAPTVEISGSFAPETGRELAVFVGHHSPCSLSVAILDEEGQVVERLCHRRSTRPMGLAGTTLYWDGSLRDGSPAPAGTYRVRAQIHWKDQTLSVESEPFEVQ